MRSQRKRFLNWVAIAVVTLAISACLCACDRTDRKPAGQPEKLTIAVVQSRYSALVAIARANNYFGDEGLNVTVQLHQTGVSALEALFAGNAELAAADETPIMFAVTGGRQLTILTEIFVSDRELALVALKERGVVAPSDLKGKKIAVTPGTAGEYFLHTYLAVNGLSPAEVVIVELAPAELTDALLAGEVDAVASRNPWIKKLQNELGGRGITFTLNPPHSLMAVLSARPDFASKRPDTVKGLLRALIRAENFAREKPRESIELVADAIGIPPDQLGEVWRPEDFRVSLDQSLLLSLEDESRWAIINGLTIAKQIPNYLEFIDIDSLNSIKPEAVNIFK